MAGAVQRGEVTGVKDEVERADGLWNSVSRDFKY